MSNNNNIGALPSAALAPSGLSPEAGSQAEQPAANAGDRVAANKALDIAFRGDASSIDDDMAQLFADHRAELLAAMMLARDMLLERQFGNPARSFSHNARVVLEHAIAKVEDAA